MKLLIHFTAILSAIQMQSCTSFMSQPTKFFGTTTSTASSNTIHNRQLTYYSSLVAPLAAQLEPEPEGGEEISSIDSIHNTRIKNMGPAEDVKDKDGDVFTFWMTSEAEGKLIKEYRDQVAKDAAKKANFPGFRKGQIPPYAQSQLTMFAVQESIIKQCQAALQAYGLKSLSGSDSSVTVHEDIKDMVKGYKVGSNLAFTATFQATFDSERSRPVVEESDDATTNDNVIDAQVESVSATE